MLDWPDANALAEAMTSLAVAHLLTEAISHGRQRVLNTHTSRTSAAIIVGQAIRLLCSDSMPLPLLRARLITKCVVLAVFHACACFIECRVRYKTRWSAFCQHLGGAVIYVLPVYPLLMVFGSSLLMIGASVLRLFGVPRDAAEWFIQLGSVHTPFWFVVQHTNRTARRQRPRNRDDALELPLSSNCKVESVGGVAQLDHEYVRRMRLLRW